MQDHNLNVLKYLSNLDKTFNVGSGHCLCMRAAKALVRPRFSADLPELLLLASIN